MTAIAAALPRASVLITAWNSGRYLGRALDSILTQTLADIEILVVDDGSTDRTPEVVDAYARRDPRVRAFHQANTGFSAAANRAIAEARAPYLAILDHDDVAVPNRLEKQVAWLDANPRVGLLGGATIAIDTDDRKLGHWPFPTGNADIRWWMFRAIVMTHSSATMRTDLVRRIGGYRTPFNIVPDLDIFLRLAEHTEMATLPEVMVYYRTHANSLGARNRPLQTAQAQVAIEMARLRGRGGVDAIPADLVIDAGTLDRLGLAADQVERLRPLFREEVAA